MEEIQTTSHIDRRVVPALVFVLSFLIFALSPVRQVTDSHYSMLLSESLVHHRTFQLDAHYAIPHNEPQWFGYYFRNGSIYQLELVEGKIYYNFPVGGPILSVPFVATMNLAGISAANPDGTYNAGGEEKIEAVIAALLMAVLSCVFFITARLVLPLKWSLTVVIAGALGTQVWSTASRAMWSDTWGILLLGIVLWMLLAREARERQLKPIVLATILSWLYIVRPTYSVHIIAISIYVLVFARHLFIRYLLTGAAWLGAFMVFSWRLYGHLLPSYYRPGRINFALFGEALPGNLISPGRGLLVYVPAVLFVAYLLVRYRREIAYPRLVMLGLFVIVGHVVFASATLHWWGGFCFGARFMTGLAPWFVLFAILGVQAMLRSRNANSGARARLIELAAGGALLVLSIAINGLGALNHATAMWNERPQNVDYHPERLWDWRQPQFLAGLLSPPLPRDVPLADSTIDFGKREADKFVWYGWSSSEGDFRWSEEREAAIIFAVNNVSYTQLRIEMMPFLAGGKLPRQRVFVSLNNQRVGTVELKEPARQEWTLSLPPGVLQQNNILKFDLPDAESPQALGVNTDRRLLGVAVQSLKLQP